MAVCRGTIGRRMVVLYPRPPASPTMSLVAPTRPRCLYRNDAELPALAMNADARKLNAMASSHVLTAPSTVTVRLLHPDK